jgi:hypothetical protein
MSGGFTDLFAVAACGAVVADAEAVTIPLLRPVAIIDAGRLRDGQGSTAGGRPRSPRALPGRYGVDPAVAHPGRRTLTAAAPHPHLPAVVRRRMVVPAGHADGAMVATALLSLCSGSASLADDPALRTVADLTGAAVVVAYLRSRGRSPAAPPGRRHGEHADPYRAPLFTAGDPPARPGRGLGRGRRRRRSPDRHARWCRP